MYYEIYLDVVFIINFMLDFIIVRITGYILRRKSTLLRCILAAAVSSFVLCIMYIFFMESFVENYFAMMLSMNVVTVVMTFYNKGDKPYKIIHILVVYYVVSFVLGGIINMVCVKAFDSAGLFKVAWWSVLLTGMAAVIAVRPLTAWIEGRREKRSICCDVELVIGEGQMRFKGIIDTGNHLKEPVSGKPVHVAELSAVEGGLKEDFVCAVKMYYEKGIIGSGLYAVKGIRMVPFRAVGTPEDKLLIAVSADIMKVKNELFEYTDRDVYVALYNGRLSGDGSYRILLHGREFIKERG